jgi:hypothetical protein
MFTNKFEIIDHGVMLSDYFSGTTGVMLSIYIDNKTTIKEILNAIKEEINIIYDHIYYTTQYHNFRGNIDLAIDTEIQKMEQDNKNRLNEIAFPDIDFDFDTEDDMDDTDYMEYPVLILSIEFLQDSSIPYPSIDNARKTGKSLQYAFKYPEKFNGMDSYIESIEQNHIEQSIEMFSIDLSWIDYYNFPVKDDIDIDQITFIHANGYYIGYEIGDKRGNMVFCGTLPLSEEIEDQADNGKYAYYYIGPNFLEVWINEEFVDFQKIEEK